MQFFVLFPEQKINKSVRMEQYLSRLNEKDNSRPNFLI